ncbi:MAG: flagellar basal body P-ring formation chaperone FlgA [Emcibacter sp.]|nr:flagellar basal body P-ring formation chaperone FlgA [Emcibacter sp.]
MKKIIYHGIFLILSLVITTKVALALAEVKSSTIVNKSTVTLEDLFDNLETGQDIWVMNAPDPGKNTTVSTRYLANLTKQHNVYWQNSRNIQHITITRSGKSIKHGDLKYIIEQELDKLNLNNKKKGISFNTKNSVLYMPENSAVEDIVIKDFNFNKQTGRFTALISVPTGDDKFTSETVSGKTHLITFIPVLNKTILPGQQITARDITSASLPTGSVGQNIIRDKKQLIGMTPVRNLNADMPLRLSDLEQPTIVTRGQLINILYQSGKISLSTIGKAIEKGGYGDVIRVMNNQTHKTIDAVIIGQGKVQVVTSRDGFAQLNIQ